MNFCVIDTEATGYAHDGRSSIIELGAVMLNGTTGEELGAWTSLVAPTYPVGAWCKGALEVTGITAQDLTTAPSATEAWGSFLAWCSTMQPVTKFFAWNVQFDQKLVAKCFEQGELIPWGACLMRACSKHDRGTRAGYKLAEAYEAAGGPQLTAHRAMADARMAAYLLQQHLQTGAWAEIEAIELEAAAKAAAKAERARARKAAKAAQFYGSRA